MEQKELEAADQARTRLRHAVDPVEQWTVFEFEPDLQDARDSLWLEESSWSERRGNIHRADCFDSSHRGNDGRPVD